MERMRHLRRNRATFFLPRNVSRGTLRGDIGGAFVCVCPRVAWPHILRSSQGGSGEGRRMGTNTVLSCSQLITFPSVPSHLSRLAFAGKKRSSLEDTRGPFPGTPERRPAAYPLGFAPRANPFEFERARERERVFERMDE